MAKTQSTRQIQQETLQTFMGMLRDADMPIDTAISQALELFSQSAGIDAPDKNQVKVIKVIDSLLGKNTRLQMQILARQGDMAKANQLAMNKVQVLREQGRLGNRKAKMEAEISKETSAFKAQQAQAARLQTAQLEQEAKKASVGFDLRKKAGMEGIRIGNIPKEAKAKAEGDVQAKFAADALTKQLAEANMSPAEKAMKRMSEENKNRILASMATTPGIPAEVTAQVNGEPLLNKLVPDESMRAEINTMVAARQARSASKAEEQIIAAGITDDAVKGTLRSKAATMGMPLDPSDLAKGKEVEAIRMQVMMDAQAQGLRLSGDLTPQSSKGIMGMFTKSGVAEATPLMSEASAALAALEPARAKAAAQSGLRMLAGGPLKTLLKGAGGIGGVGLLLAMLGNKKDKTEEIPLHMQMQMQKDMEQQQLQSALAQSLIQSRDSSSQLNAAKAMMLQFQARQMMGAPSGGIV